MCCRFYASLWQALPTALTKQMKEASPISGYKPFLKDVKSNIEMFLVFVRSFPRSKDERIHQSPPDQLFFLLQW